MGKNDTKEIVLFFGFFRRTGLFVCFAGTIKIRPRNHLAISALQKRPNQAAKEAISQRERAHFASSFGNFENANRQLEENRSATIVLFFGFSTLFYKIDKTA